MFEQTKAIERLTSSCTEGPGTPRKHARKPLKVRQAGKKRRVYLRATVGHPRPQSGVLLKAISARQDRELSLTLRRRAERRGL